MSRQRVRASSAAADTTGSGLVTTMSWCAMAGMSSASAASQADSAAFAIACLSALHLLQHNPSQLAQPGRILCESYEAGS